MEPTGKKQKKQKKLYKKHKSARTHTHTQSKKPGTVVTTPEVLDVTRYHKRSPKVHDKRLYELSNAA